MSGDGKRVKRINTKKKFVADGVFQAELNEFLERTLGMEGYAGIEVRATSMSTEIRIKATKAKEILETGLCTSLEKIEGEKAMWAAYELFMGIHGIGPSFAADLAEDGYRSIEDLRAAVAAKTLTLNKTQTIGLEHYESIQERIPRSEMELHEARLKEVVTVPSDVGYLRPGLPSADLAGAVAASLGAAAYVMLDDDTPEAGTSAGTARDRRQSVSRPSSARL
jgi:hypothetical protein